jgi:tRNA 2-thiouridine synthesizing protein B
MPVLHVVSGSPQGSQALIHCLARMQEGDALLLSANGVYAALANSGACRWLDVSPPLSVYVLAPDLEARGIAVEELWPGAERIDYEGFVDLAVRYPISLSWC